MEKLKKFFKLIRIKETLLSIPLAYVGLIFAGGDEIYTWLMVTLAMISARTIGIISNKLIGYSIDARDNSFRGIPVSQKENSKPLLLVTGIISASILVYSSYLLNQLCFYLSFAGLFLLLTYSYMKRLTWARHFYFGLVETAAPIGGYIAETGRFEPAALILGGAILLWIAGLDIYYSIQNMESEKRENVFSIPLRFGHENAMLYASLLYLSSITVIVTLGFLTSRGLAFWAAVICVAIIFIRQHMLARNSDTQASMDEFFQINNFVSPVLFVGTFIDVIFR